MDIAEFFQTLKEATSLLHLHWFITKNRRAAGIAEIRGKDPYGRCYCPISAVANMVRAKQEWREGFIPLSATDDMEEICVLRRTGINTVAADVHTRDLPRQERDARKMMLRTLGLREIWLFP